MKKSTNMASLLTLLFTSSITIFLASTLAMAESARPARDFKVGGDFGWQVPTPNNKGFYSQWAARKRFHIGDSLSFELKNESVLVVEKWDYYHCNTSQPIEALTDDKSAVFKLQRAGPFYFISGDTEHCKEGQQLLVEVMSPHDLSPSSSVPPESDSAMAPSRSSSSGSVVSVTFSSVCLFPVAALVAASVFSQP